jgi:hypothetical protein
MSWVLNYFRPTASSNPPAVSNEDALDKTHDSIEALEAKRLQLLQKIAKLFKEAQQLKSEGKTKQALDCMKRKAALEKQVVFYDGQIQNLERAALGIDSTAMAVQVAETMKSGSESIKAMTQKVSVTEIESIADDLDEHIMDSNDLMSALARPLGSSALEDSDMDEELMKELEGGGKGGGQKEKIKIIPEEEEDVDFILPDLPPSKKEEIKNF